MKPPEISYRDVREVTDELDENGFACLEGAVPQEWLSLARAAVENRLSRHGERDHFIRSPQGEEHRAEEALIASPSVHEMLKAVVRARFADGSADEELTGSALRIIAGPRGKGDAWWFHYDASIVTMVVPILMPDAGRGVSGELVGFFNKRPFRRFVIMNIIEKMVAQSRFYRWLILRRLGGNDIGQIVDMEVGNAYLFWGYRSLHANMPCKPGAVRATLLLHFGRPHSGSSALTAAIRLQQMLRKAQGQQPSGYGAAEVTAAGV
jgi:hypothetical protein